MGIVDNGVTPDGALVDNGVVLPDGAVVLPDGAILLPDGAVIVPGSLAGGACGCRVPAAGSREGQTLPLGLAFALVVGVAWRRRRRS